MRNIKIITSIVGFFDITFIYINSSINIATPILILSVLLSMIIFLEPLYKLSHVAFHIVILVHTYYICLSNTI